MNKKGFTLLELLGITVVLIVIFLMSIPIVKGIIEYSRFKAFKTSSMNTIDAVDLYIAKNNFTSIPEDGIDIEDLDSSILKNNNFDSGRIIRRNNKTQIIYLKQDKYCSKGTKAELISSDKGCGALDDSEPEKANLFLKNETNDYLYIVAQGFDSNSKIIKYELKIDNGKYFSNKNSSYNVFKITKDQKNHRYQIRVTNEANLTKESEYKKFEHESETVICIEENNLENVKSNKNISCNLEENKFINETKNYKLSVKNNLIQEIDNLNATLNIVNIDDVLGESIPVLDQNMIPIIYDENISKWVVANKNKAYYDYENKKWANAVVVRKDNDIDDYQSKTREYYLSDDAIGKPIYEKDILGYFVWIPKFSYKLWNKSGIDINDENKGVQTIDILFKNIDEEIIKNNNYINHKAFSYENLNGFWISKYEANVGGSTNCTISSNITNCNNDSFNLLFNNNTSILKNISISNAYKNIIKLNTTYNKYGTVGNIHLITNLEWGAVAYLSHSKYGINKNIHEETTTGNVTGVYNMGINKEFVFGNYNYDIGLNKENNSGFDKLPNVYMDIYKSSSVKGGMLGDATLETENWYDSDHDFINGNYPFIVRGNNGIFSFNNSTGTASDTTFRVAIFTK